MADSRIREKILKDAKDDANRIIKEAKEKARGIIKQATAEEMDVRKQTKELAMKAKNRELERRFSESRMHNKAQILAEKRKVIDSVFAEAKNRILLLEKREYIKFICNMIKDEVKKGKFSLVLSGKDVKRFGKGIFKEILLELGCKEETEFENSNFDGGCILKKDTYEFNATVDTVLHKIKESFEGELAKILFS